MNKYDAAFLAGLICLATTHSIVGLVIGILLVWFSVAEEDQ